MVLARLAGALQPASDPNVPFALAREAIARARTLEDDVLLKPALPAVLDGDRAPKEPQLVAAASHVAFSMQGLAELTGAVANHSGSCAWVVWATMRASGCAPMRRAVDSVIITRAAAPSLIPEALAAVTVPSFLNAARKPAAPSSVASCLMYSSFSTTVSPLRPFTVTATISSLNLPAFCAASALFCEATAKASCTSRDSCHWRATFSAVLPMW